MWSVRQSRFSRWFRVREELADLFWDLRRCAHRFRKEGHIKLVEFSLTTKQQSLHRAAGIRRKDLRRLEELGERKASNGNGMDVDGGSDDGSANGKGKGRQLDESDSDESDEAESEEEMDVDDEDEDEGKRGKREKDVGGVKQKQTERIVMPQEVRAHLRILFQNENALVSLLYAPHGPLSASSPSLTDASGTASPDIFFMDVVCVPPSRFRPAATMGDQVFENSQNSLLNGVLRQTFSVRDFSESFARAQVPPEEGKPEVDKNRVYLQLQESLITLQVTVNSMVDSTKNPMIVRGGKLPPQGVKQLLEKKEGLFRKNMMVRPPSFISQL